MAEGHEQQERRQHRQTVLLLLFVVVSVLVCFLLCVYSSLSFLSRKMPKTGCKFVRQSPRQRGNPEICARPFKAPRSSDSDVHELGKGTVAEKDSQVQIIVIMKTFKKETRHLVSLTV